MKKFVEVENGKEQADMCKAMDDWYQEGVELGMERGIQGIISLCQKIGGKKEDAIATIMNSCVLNKEKAMEYIETYWK